MRLNLGTVKYYKLAIEKYSPLLKKLQNESNAVDAEEEIDDLLEMYSEVLSEINKRKLNTKNPNRQYPGEPLEIEIDLNKEVIKHFSMLVLRMLEDWKSEKEKIDKKGYITEKVKRKSLELDNLIWPLEGQFNNTRTKFYKNKDNERLIFPSEHKKVNVSVKGTVVKSDKILPDELIENLPNDMQKICHELNFNYNNKKPYSCILLLRRLLPLSIVRKFQQVNTTSQ